MFFTICSSQENTILERLSVLRNSGKTWYNIDGYSVTSEIFKESFNGKGLKKVLKKHNILDSDIKIKNSKIHNNNFFVTKQQKVSENSSQTNNYYFVENNDKVITVIWFIKNGKTNSDTEEKLINAIIDNQIPETNFVPMKISSISFADRKIDLENSCYWTFLNTVQCPYLGEMNWSIHQTLESAKESIANQYLVTKSKKGGKIVSEEMINVDFEGVSTQAKKIIIEFSSINSALAGMSRGNSLSIYYVAETVRNKNISCVMSFWNNDQINSQTKLPPLLEKLMILK